MTKSSKGKSPKGRKPLFYVDNPNTSELKWLDALNKKTVAQNSVDNRSIQDTDDNQQTLNVNAIRVPVKQEPKVETESNHAWPEGAQPDLIEIDVSDLVEVFEVVDEQEEFNQTQKLEKLEEKKSPDAPVPFIYTDDLVDFAVTAEKIASGAIDSSKLGTGIVTSDVIADYAVDTVHIADGAIKSAKI